MIELTDRKAVITGAARGIGYAIAMAFVKSGAEVLAVDLDSGGLDQLQKEAPEGHVHTFAVNLTEDGAADRIVAAATERMGTIDTLVNNAGITRDGLLMRMSPEDWDLVLNVNLRAAFLLTQKVSRIMLKARKGAVVNVVSVVGQIGNAGQANYSAAKAGLEAFTKSCAREMASRQVRVNAVAPGFIATAMTERLPDKAKEAFLTQIPLGRAGTPEDVADAILFLASDHAKYVNGQVLRVDGGMVM
jgi:3-oxoacyl-[acyl-carrier protein] reductase